MGVLRTRARHVRGSGIGTLGPEANRAALADSQLVVLLTFLFPQHIKKT